jgi:hypothetical protein
MNRLVDDIVRRLMVILHPVLITICYLIRERTKTGSKINGVDPVFYRRGATGQAP